MARFTAALFACLIPLVPLAGETSAYTNPLTVPGVWPDYGVGDPFVFRWNGTYYLYASTKDGQPGIEAFTSPDLVHWTAAGLVADDAASVGAYAPEVTYWNGWFTLCTSPAGNGHFFYRSRSPLGPFVRFTENLAQSIDGSFFRDEDGQGYFFRASTRGIVGLKWDGGAGLSDETLLAGTWLGHWTEGPYLLRRGGRLFLTLTGNHVLSDGYRVNYAVSETGPLGPYTMPGDNPLLLSTAADFRGLGHSSSVVGPDLQSWWIAYHQFDGFSASNLPLRRLNLDRLVFHSAVLAAAGPSHQPMPAPAGPTAVMNFGTVAGTEALDSRPTGPEWTAEWTLLDGGTGRFGVVFGASGPGQGTRVWLDPARLFAGFDPRVPHGVRAEAEAGTVTLWVDGFRLPPVKAPTDGLIGVVQDGAGLKVGYAAFTTGRPSISDQGARMPLPGRLDSALGPGTDWNVAVAEAGVYQLTARLTGAAEEVAAAVDGAPVPWLSKGEGGTLGRLVLPEGWHRLTLTGPGAASIASLEAARWEPVTAQTLRTPPWLLLSRGRYWAGDPRWSDYRVTVTLKGAEKSTAPAGLMVRTTQESNYKDQVATGFLGYQVEVLGGRLSLLRVKYEKVDELASARVPAGSPLTLTVEVQNGELRVFTGTDPKPLLRAADPDRLSHGRVGVYTGSPAVTFSAWSVEPLTTN